MSPAQEEDLTEGGRDHGGVGFSGRVAGTTPRPTDATATRVAAAMVALVALLLMLSLVAVASVVELVVVMVVVVVVAVSETEATAAAWNKVCLSQD